MKKRKRFLFWISNSFFSFLFFLFFNLFFNLFNLENNMLIFLFYLVITHVTCHLGDHSVKIGQKVTIAKGLNLRGQNFHFFY